MYLVSFDRKSENVDEDSPSFRCLEVESWSLDLWSLDLQSSVLETFLRSSSLLLLKLHKAVGFIYGICYKGNLTPAVNNLQQLNN